MALNKTLDQRDLTIYRTFHSKRTEYIFKGMWDIL